LASRLLPVTRAARSSYTELAGNASDTGIINGSKISCVLQGPPV